MDLEEQVVDILKTGRYVVRVTGISGKIHEYGPYAKWYADEAAAWFRTFNQPVEVRKEDE